MILIIIVQASGAFLCVVSLVARLPLGVLEFLIAFSRFTDWRTRPGQAQYGLEFTIIKRSIKEYSFFLHPQPDKKLNV